MDSMDEVVETSDPEELEEIAASKPDYWLMPPRDLARPHESKRLPPDIGKPEGPPRKRRKLDSSPEHPSTPLQPRTNLPDAYPSQQPHPTSHFLDENSSAPTSSPSSFLFPSPSQRPQQLDGRASPGYFNHGLWAGGDGDFVQGSSKQSAQREVQRKASTRSPSPSPDSLLLFTPPRPTSVSPGPDRTAVSSPISSPLTPASSPAKLANADSPALDAQPRPSPARQHGMPALSAADIAAIEQAEEAERSRYSLRTRNARQLKPYAYDMRMYNRQMRANPEAIVTPSRVRRRHRSTSAHPRDGSSGGGDEYEAGEDEDMYDEDPMARRGRKRNIEQEDREEGGDGMREGVEKWMPEAFRQSSSSSEDDANVMFRSTVGKGKKPDKEPRRKRPKPFPLTKKDLQRSASPHKPLERSPSLFHEAPPHPKERPKPRLRPREPIAELKHQPQDSDEDDDDKPLVPAPTWRRRRSRTFSSPKSSPQSRPSRSPFPQPPLPADNDFFGELADNDPGDLNAFNAYDDVFARAQSPFALAATSGTELDEPTSQHPPPPTSDEPMDVIDITSSSSVATDSSSESGSDVDRVNQKRMRILNKMMPAVMVQKMAAEAKAQKAARAEREREREREAGSAESEQPLMPGQSRRRIGSRRSVEIRGDSESDDDDVDVDMRSRSPSSAPGAEGERQPHDWYRAVSDAGSEVIEPIGHQPRPRYRPGHISVSDHDLSTDSDDDDVDLAVGRWVSGAPAKPKRRMQDDGVVKERDMIDRMLSRSSGNSRSRKKRTGGHRGGGHRAGGGGGGGGSGGGGRRRRNGDIRNYGVLDGGEGGGGHRGTGGGGGGGGQTSRGHGGPTAARQGDGLRITTSSAKRYGAGQQTLLTFPRRSTPEPGELIEVDDVAPPLPPSNEVQFTGNEPADAKAKKKAKQKAKQTGVYVFKSGATHMVSGRSNTAHVTIGEETAAKQPPPFHNAGRTRPPTSKSKLQRQSSKRSHATLEEFWNPDDDHYEHDGFVVSDGPAPGPPSQHNRAWKGLQHVTLDFGIQPLPAGIAFSNATYLGHGWLHELIALLPATHDIPTPLSCSMFDCYLHADMTVLELTTCLDVLYNQLRDLVLRSTGPADYDSCQKWQSFFHSVSQHLSYLLVKANDDARVMLATNTEALVQRLGSLMEDPTEIIPDDEIPNPLVLQVLWFLVETSCRIACHRRRKHEEPDRGMVATTLISLIRKLWDFTFGDAAVPLELTREGITAAQTPQQVAELWVCLLNLASDKMFQSSFLPQGMAFWTCYLQVLHGKGLQAHQTDVKAREAIWRSIFALCALSQFSIHGHSSMTPRLTPSWRAIAAVLERAPLSAGLKEDASLTKRVLKKRDEYVSVLIARCQLLNNKWHWRLDSHEALSVFNRLLAVFKTRHFANLVSDSVNDFPSFLRKHNLSLLQETKHSDSAFIIVLKLVVRAADETRKDNPQDMASQIFIKKILSLTIPVSSVPFKKTSPPSSHDMSMLFNRFSTIAVAIYLEPTVAKVSRWLLNARRYVNYKDADKNTRVACIRGAMYLAILLRHLDLPLTDILEWLADMTNILIDEYQVAFADQGHEKSWTEYTIQLLLRSVCHILQTSSMDPENIGHKYPDPSLLQGPWVTRIFSTATNLSISTSTSNEIRTFVQAFLNARGRVIPPPRRPPPRAVVEDSQDSQDDYGQFDIDLDDPELLAALGEDTGPSDYKENKERDKVVCETIDKYISPAIYRLVCKHFNDPVYRESRELSFHDADKWVDCWVGCASVMVQNGKKDWAFYFQYGSQSWEHITDPDGKRRVGLRFMIMLLQLDPPAYQTYTEQFVEVLFRSMATPNVTLEHDYASLLFSIDRLYHPLLDHLPINPPGEDGDFHLTRQEFIDKRLAILESMIKNLSNSLGAQGRGDHSLDARNNTYITSVMALMSTMKEISEGLSPGTVIRANYIPFCKQISDILARYPAVFNHHRLTTLTTRLRSVS